MKIWLAVFICTLALSFIIIDGHGGHNRHRNGDFVGSCNFTNLCVDLCQHKQRPGCENIKVKCMCPNQPIN